VDPKELKGKEGSDPLKTPLKKTERKALFSPSPSSTIHLKGSFPPSLSSPFVSLHYSFFLFCARSGGFHHQLSSEMASVFGIEQEVFNQIPVDVPPLVLL
jgi:hypothetical protein